MTRGRIALEIEAAELYFRNVEIRDLDYGVSQSRECEAPPSRFGVC